MQREGNKLQGIKRGRGRPAGSNKEIDVKTVESAAGIGCTVEEIAAVVGVSTKTIYSRMKDAPEIMEAIERGRETGKATLRRLQWQGAQAGNATMLVWLGKQILGQRDQVDTNISVAKPLEELLKLIAEKPAAEAVG